jgi:GPH family glycoside/pentoside/hexuronide:cation symporter
MGGMLAGMIIMIGVPLIAYTEDALGNSVMVGERITIAAGVFSVLAVICYLLCYKLVTERVVVDNAMEEQPGIREMISSAMGNRALISIIAAAILMLLSQLTMQGMANYVYPNYYGDPTAQSASSAMMAVGMVAAAAMAKPLGAKFGKAEVSAVCCAFATVMNILLFFVRPESVWVYAGFQMLSWLGLGVFQMVCWALITDVIDDTEVKTGRREDGTVYAIYSWARKLGQAASSGLMGWLLTLIGYTDATAFDPVVTEGIFNISVIVPVIGFGALALVLVFWYPLHKKAVDANVEFLNAKHGRS